MNHIISRRTFVALSVAAASTRILTADPLSMSLETPYKYSKLVLGPSGEDGKFDSKSVDCPFVFRHGDLWWMTFVAFDGIGYQTGLAKSKNLVNWEKVGCILKRDPASSIRKYNVAMNWILRENNMASPGRLIQINGQFIGAYHSYPDSGYESGPAVIGLAYSNDLLHWVPREPILRSQDGADWESGGLYKPCLLRDRGTYYLFYNAKNHVSEPWNEQSGVATSKDLKTWIRYASNPILKNGGPGSYDQHFASDPCVLRNSTEWVFFYFGLDAKGVARELVATGPDLFHPSKRAMAMVEPGPPGSYDSKYTHKPSIVAWRGDLYHFYCAVGGNPQIRGISVARSRPW